MKTVLGLSLTSGGVGWVLVDGDAPDGAPLDDDAFEVDSTGELADRGTAAARGARAIAASSGQEVRSVGIIWSDDVDTEARQLIASLAASGFSDVRIVPSDLATPAADDDGEDDGAEVHLSLAQAAAHAVATGAVTVRRAQCHVVQKVRARRSTGVRVGGAAAAAVVVAVLTVGSQSVPEVFQPAPEQPAPASGGTPQVVSVAVPLAGTPAAVRPVAKQPAAETAERADRTPVYEPTESFEVTESSPVVQAAQPAAPIDPPASTPEAAPLAVAHLPVTALPGPAAPQLFAPGPVPAAVTAPIAGPAPAAVPVPAEPAPAVVPPPQPIFVNPILAGLP